MNSKKFQLQIGLSAYVIGSIIMSAVAYYHTKSHLIEDIDERLKSAAYMTAKLLGDSFHYEGMENSKLALAQDTKVSKMLTDFSKQVGFEYLYSTIKIENDIYFVASSGTHEEVANNKYAPVFLTKYDEANKKLRETFALKKINFSEYTDRWGNFRSIYIPQIASDGKEYVVAADISLKHVDSASSESAILALITAIMLAVIVFPLSYFYIKIILRERKTELKALYYCPLTQLPNRAKLIADIKQKQDASVAIINIDRFREISGLYGPAIGDDVLKQVAMRLRTFDASKFDNFKAYRLNSDEFAVMVKGHQTPQLLEDEFLSLYQYLIKNPYKLGAEKINLRVRIGAAENTEDAFIRADMALREAKKSNKSTVLFNNNLKIAEAYQRNFDTTQSFKKALDEERFIPYFQPIVNAKTKNIEKYECLARMVDHQGNIVGMPDDFLPVAYRSRLYYKFSCLMLDKVLNYLKSNDVVVSLNISAADIYHKPTRKYFIEKLSQSGSSHKIEFEILENQSFEDIKPVIRFIQQLKSLGCKVGIDDLGKDYSNIDRLMKLPIDFVKIDGSIVLHLASDIDAQDIAKKIIEYSSKRNVKTVAEFCCSEEICNLVTGLGVDYLQGYFLGEPELGFAPLVIHSKSKAVG